MNNPFFKKFIKGWGLNFSPTGGASVRGRVLSKNIVLLAHNQEAAPPPKNLAPTKNQKVKMSGALMLPIYAHPAVDMRYLETVESLSPRSRCARGNLREEGT